MAENQLLRLHRTRGIDMELQPRRMPPLKRLNGVGIDVALDLAGFIALTPDAALQFLERRGLAILVHPAEQHGDDLFGRKVRLPFGADRKSTRLNSSTNAHLVCRLLLAKQKKKLNSILRTTQHLL